MNDDAVGHKFSVNKSTVYIQQDSFKQQDVFKL